MISLIIIEDDFLSSDLLIRTLSLMEVPVRIEAVLRSVKDSVDFLSSHQHQADLILADVQLSDGLVFSIFEQVEVGCPVIFTSSYDHYLMDTFQYSGIDYLVKPVDADRLREAILKYQRLESHFSRAGAIRTVMDYVEERKDRLIVKKGVTYIPLPLEEAAFFFTEKMLTYVVDGSGARYRIDKTLSELENDLDPRIFFRVNRQYIVNIRQIESFKSHEKVKLLVRLKAVSGQTVLVSQERAKMFRKWVGQD